MESRGESDVPNACYELKCILCQQPCNADDNMDNTSHTKWDNLKHKSFLWKELDKFQHAYAAVEWDKGPKGMYMHSTCYTQISGNRYIQQAQNRKRKSEQEEKAQASTSSEQQPVNMPKRLRSSTGVVHDKNLCVWCMKGPQKTSNRDKSNLLLLSTEDAWNRFKVHTISLTDEPMRERLNTLLVSVSDSRTAFGLEIRYHRACWRTYVSNPLKKFLSDENTEHLQHVNLREAQAIFFQHVRQVIFEDHEIRTLQGLLNDYKRITSNYGYYSTAKSSFLKETLIKEFGDDIAFHERRQKNASELVYDTRGAGSYLEAAISSLGVSDDQLVKNVAGRLRDQIIKTKTVPWPPYLHELEADEDLNDLLLKLITWLKHPTKSEVDDKPPVRSIASILTSYITGRRTAFKTNLAVLLHGLAKSREMVDILHKDGLGISYNDVLMLRDFWAVNDLKHSTECPFELYKGIPALCVVDNDDFKSDTLTGSGQSHRTNVMFVQRQLPELNLPTLDEDRPVANSALPSFLSASLKELGSQMQRVEPYKTSKRGEPPIRPRITDEEHLNTAHQRMRGVIHAMARSKADGTRPKPEDQSIPAFSGFQAKLSPETTKSQAIYHMTYPDPPGKSILYDVLCKLAKAIGDKEMPFAVIVGDHPVYALFLELKSENPDMFADILPFMGPFHIHMSFINAIYKRFKGSGISDVLVAAGVVADGSVDQALRGKHFNRGVRCLRLFYEALVYSALDKRLEGYILSEEIQASLSKLRCSVDQQELNDAHAELENNADLKVLVDSLFQNFDGAPHAEFWISFLEMVEILTQNIHSIRTRNWLEFKSSLKLMLPWMHIYDNDRYGRHLPDFIAVLESLPQIQADFMESGMFAHSMTGKPYSCVALDIWIESTMNKGSKLKSGWLAILKNEKQLLSNTRNVNNVNRIRLCVHRHANHKRRGSRQHADCAPRKMKIDEQSVQDIGACLTEFHCDPFDQSDQTLRSLQSGIEASLVLSADFKSAKADGERRVEEFVNERVFSKTKSLNARIPRCKRGNFATQEVEKTGSENLKQATEEMQSKAFASVIKLVEANDDLKMEELMHHRVTDECLSIFNANGTMRKTQKSKLQEKLTMTSIPYRDIYTSIVDMGLIWRLSTPTTEDREKADGTKFTWGDYSEKLVNFVLSRHTNAERIILVNDSYEHDFSIKDSERQQRQRNQPIRNVFMKSKDQFPSCRDFHAILAKPENKVRLQAFIETSFKRKATTTTSELIYCVVGKPAKNLTTDEVLQNLTCAHAEADTALFTLYGKLRSEGYSEAVVIDTEDTDNYVQAAYVARQISGLLCLKRKSQLISARCLCDEAMAESLIPLHILTGCDHNSGFYGVGKKTIVDRVEKSSEAHNLLKKCGTVLPVTQEIINDLQKFVIRYIYRDTKHKTLAEVRAAKWSVLKKKKTIRLVPDSDSLRLHLERANYLTYLQKNFQLQNHPSPIGHGWHLVNGLCLPVRYTQPPLPQYLELPTTSSNIQMDSSDDDSGSDSDSCASYVSCSDDES